MPRETVSTRLVRALGWRRATVVLSFVMVWSMFRELYDRDPESIDELATEIERERTTVFRWQADFRRAFPEFSTPGDLLDAVNVQRTVSARQAGRLVLP